MSRQKETEHKDELSSVRVTMRRRRRRRKEKIGTSYLQRITAVGERRRKRR
jgi:hypothetical protein